MKQTRKILSVLLALVILLTVMPSASLAAFAESSIIDSGTCGDKEDNLTWVLYDDGRLFFDLAYSTGSSIYMSDFEPGGAPWYSYATLIKTVDIASSSNLINSIWGIGSYAFYGCSSLETVIIPTNIHKIGENAFAGCISIKTVYTGFDEETWNGNGSSWIYIKIMSGNDSLLAADIIFDTVSGEGQCGSNLTWKLDVDGTLTISGTGNMEWTDETGWNESPWCEYNRYIKSVVIDEGVTSIQSMSFFDCDMESLHLPSTLRHIYGVAFKCPNLSTITVSHNSNFFTVADNILYSKDMTTLVLYPCAKTDNTIKLAPSVTTIGNGAFRGCTNLTYLDFTSSSLQNIDEYAFMECESISSVKLPLSCKNIDSHAFYWCRSLKYIDMPGIESIGACALGATALERLDIPASLASMVVGGTGDSLYSTITITEFSVDDANPLYSSVDGVLFNKDKTALLYYPCGSTREEYSIPEGILYFDNISGSKLLKKVTIPSSVTYIDGWAFSGCDKLETIVLPDTLTGINYYAFQGCDSLNHIVIPDGVTALYEWTFNSCSSLTDIKLPDSMTVIDGAFIRCSELKQIRLPSKLEKIGDSTFEDCVRLENIVIPDNVKTIGKNAFTDCISLKNIVILCDNAVISDNAIDALSSYSGNLADKTIYCHAGSTAETYAKEHDIDYVIIDSSLTYDDIYFAKEPIVNVNDSVFELYADEEMPELSVNAEVQDNGVLTYSWYRSSSETLEDAEEIKGAANPSYVPTVSAPGTYYYFAVVSNYCSDALISNTATAKSEPIRVSVINRNDIAPETEIPARTNNAHNNSYRVWASPVQSYLYEDNGKLVRLENADSNIIAETYNSSFEIESVRAIEPELEYFGGAYIGKNYNYLFFGQNNTEEDVNKEVYRVVKYTKNWERICSCSLYGVNTTVPFDAGSLRADEYGDRLYVRTSHEMFTFMDGLNHQANVTFIVDTKQMVITAADYNISNPDTGYVSHSFNQFISYDPTNGTIVAVDHSDDRDVGVGLFVYDYRSYGPNLTFSSSDPNTAVSTIQYASMPSPSWTKLYSFSGNDGDNYTGASVGGMIIGENAYLVALSSEDQSEAADNSSRDIYVCISKKESISEINTVKLTDYDSVGSFTAGTPYIISIDNGSYLVLWEKSDIEFANTELCYVIINENGEIIDDIMTVSGMLSDCEPILFKENVIWYVTDGNKIAFYSIDLNTMQLSSTEMKFPDSTDLSDAAPTTEPTPPANDSDRITVNESNKFATVSMDGRKESLTAADFKASLGNENVKIVDKDGNELESNALVGTGSKVQLLNESGNVVSEYEVIVPSDVNGDGKTTAADARSALRASARLDDIVGVYSIAADMSGDEKITAADARTILRKSAGLE